MIVTRICGCIGVEPVRPALGNFSADGIALDFIGNQNQRRD